MRFKSFKTFEWGDPWDHDPSAPWNQEDPDIVRDTDWIDGREASKRIKFEFLSSDFSELALLKSIEDGIYYALYIGGDQIEEYRPKMRQADGRDEDGDMQYEYENLDLDEESVIALASDILDQTPEEIGKGLTDWEDGKILCMLDISLLEEIEHVWKNTPKIQNTVKEIKQGVIDQRGKVAAKKFGF